MPHVTFFFLDKVVELVGLLSTGLPRLVFFGIFTDSAFWAGSIIESRYLFNVKKIIPSPCNLFWRSSSVNQPWIRPDQIGPIRWAGSDRPDWIGRIGSAGFDRMDQIGWIRLDGSDQMDLIERIGSDGSDRRCSGSDLERWSGSWTGILKKTRRCSV